MICRWLLLLLESHYLSCLALEPTSSEVISFLILNLIRIESAAVSKIRLEEMQ